MNKLALIGFIIFTSYYNSIAQNTATTENDQPKPKLEATDTMALVKFKITDFEEVPEADAVLHIKGSDNKLDYTVNTNVDGQYTLLLPEGKSFNINVEKFGKNFNFGKMEIPSSNGPVEFDQVLQIKVVTSYLDSYILENVYFDSNKADVKPESQTALNLLVDAMKDDIRLKIEIAGHSDNLGDPHRNLELSQLRAESVKSYLMRKGISPSRIIAKGYGQLKPIADNNTLEGRKKNRRTEVKIIEKSPSAPTK